MLEISIGGLIAGSVAVIGGAVGYGVLKARVAGLERRIDTTERILEELRRLVERMATVETRLDSVLHYIRDGGYARYINNEPGRRRGSGGD